MLKSKWVPFIFILALAFAISIARSITPNSHVRVNSHNNHYSKSNSHVSSELLVFAHFSSSDFIAGVQVNLCPIVNWVEEDEDEDGDGSLLQVSRFFLAVHSP